VEDLRAVYDGWVAALPGILFMNSGLAERGPEAYEWIRPRDRPHKYHLSLARRVLRDVELSGRSVLEIGSGRGGNCYYLSHYSDVRRTVGLDSSAGTVRAASQIGAHKAQFVCGAVEHLPFAPKSFDVVFSIESSPSYPNYKTLLREVDRVLARGGVFVYMDLFNDARREALRAGPLKIAADEDVSEDVFEALNSADGLEQLLRESTDQTLVKQIVDYTARARESLAVGFLSARVVRMAKARLTSRK
jgi:ubiquinone/menaquinone biosynthesis C-methylase UbiE